MAKLASNMPPKFAGRFRAICVAVALGVATAHLLSSAETKPNSLVGATREQVLEKLGEPKNTIVAGNREVLLFDRDRVTLRDNVVIQIERLPEPVRRPAPPAETAPAAPAAATTGSTSPASTDATANRIPVPAPTPATSATTPAANSATASVPAAPPAPDPNAPLDIKVRAAGTVRPAPATTKSAPAASSEKPVAPAPLTPANAVAPVTTPPVASTTPAAAPANEASKTTSATPAPPQKSEKSDDAAKPAAETAVTEPAKTDDATPSAEDSKAKTKKAKRRSADSDLPEEPAVFTGSTYLIGAVTIGAGIAFLVWRTRQRQLELAASAVSRTPFSAPAATGAGGAVFTPDLLAKLEWKRFEELVAAYYSKTGVVAVRTKTGPASAVHIKISWKGEPQPFALVQCIAHPQGLIDAKPLHELVTVLAAEDIRRGYVVTTGKFNVPARDFAEEKHITLLPGDILLEKINALPDAARNELMQETTTGDYTTPSCPKCEAKMVRNPDDSSQWRCAAHPDQIIPAK
jgi:hypothetical protein